LKDLYLWNGIVRDNACCALLIWFDVIVLNLKCVTNARY
jgi:hypothetical protein